MKKYLIYNLFLLVGITTFSQSADSTKKDTSKYVSFFTSQEVTFEKKKEVPTEFKKKKVGKKTFYGIKTRKAYILDGFGDKQTMEVVYYTKKWINPNHYAQDIFYFDLVSQKIGHGKKYDSTTCRLLHGPYKKTFGPDNALVEEGIYYLGTKHGRWMKWKKPRKVVYDTLEVNEQELVSKEFYFRGWPKEAELSYYDLKYTKLKEVKPIVEGELHGNYYLFDEHGHILTKGHYTHGVKSGIWDEYTVTTTSKGKPSHKRTVAYLNEFYEPEKEMVIKEWNEKGEQIVDKTKEYDKFLEDKRKKEEAEKAKKK